MKDFFILWGMLTGSFMLAVYGLSQIDWVSSRVLLCVSAFVSFFIALSVCTE